MIDMKKGDKVGMIIMLVLIIVIGGWIAIVSSYVYSNVSEEEVKQLNPFGIVASFIAICVALMCILLIKRPEKEEKLIKR